MGCVVGMSISFWSRPTARVLHSNEAFFRGVNAVISAKDSERIENILDLAMGEFKSYTEPWAVAAQRLHLKG
jgi:hypothetical protein